MKKVTKSLNKTVGDSPSSIPKMVIVPGSSVMATRSSNMQKDRDGSFIYRRRQSALLVPEPLPSTDGKGDVAAHLTRSHHGRDDKAARYSFPLAGPRAQDRKRSSLALGNDSDSPGPMSSSTHKRRRTIRSIADGSYIESDAYCWLCHEEGLGGVCCDVCPRLYHVKCLGIESPPVPSAGGGGNWICSECEQVLRAENVETRSRAMSMISIDTLCSLFRYVVQRMKFPETEPFHRPVDSASIPTYTDYVFNPMDFSTLEKNIKKRHYGSTEAFVADVKWILHNCIVFNGKKHALTSIAKTVLKICKHETSDIEICPDCYMNFCEKNANWFCQPCRTPHTLVWAKMKGYPFWPAKVLRVENGQADCRFFGEHDRAWMPVSQVFLLSEEPPTVLKNKPGFEAATRELHQHIDIIRPENRELACSSGASRKRRLRQKFGSFEYAPHRTPYDELSPYRSTKSHHSPSEQLPGSEGGGASSVGGGANSGGGTGPKKLVRRSKHGSWQLVPVTSDESEASRESASTNQDAGNEVGTSEDASASCGAENESGDRQLSLRTAGAVRLMYGGITPTRLATSGFSGRGSSKVASARGAMQGTRKKGRPPRVARQLALTGETAGVAGLSNEGEGEQMGAGDEPEGSEAGGEEGASTGRDTGEVGATSENAVRKDENKAEQALRGKSVNDFTVVAGENAAPGSKGLGGGAGVESAAALDVSKHSNAEISPAVDNTGSVFGTREPVDTVQSPVPRSDRNLFDSIDSAVQDALCPILEDASTTPLDSSSEDLKSVVDVDAPPLLPLAVTPVKVTGDTGDSVAPVKVTGNTGVSVIPVKIVSGKETQPGADSEGAHASLTGSTAVCIVRNPVGPDSEVILDAVHSSVTAGVKVMSSFQASIQSIVHEVGACPLSMAEKSPVDDSSTVLGFGDESASQMSRTTEAGQMNATESQTAVLHAGSDLGIGVLSEAGSNAVDVTEQTITSDGRDTSGMDVEQSTVLDGIKVVVPAETNILPESSVNSSSQADAGQIEESGIGKLPEECGEGNLSDDRELQQNVLLNDTQDSHSVEALHVAVDQKPLPHLVQRSEGVLLQAHTDSIASQDNSSRDYSAAQVKPFAGDSVQTSETQTVVVSKSSAIVADESTTASCTVNCVVALGATEAMGSDAHLSSSIAEVDRKVKDHAVLLGPSASKPSGSSSNSSIPSTGALEGATVSKSVVIVIADDDETTESKRNATGQISLGKTLDRVSSFATQNFPLVASVTLNSPVATNVITATESTFVIGNIMTLSPGGTTPISSAASGVITPVAQIIGTDRENGSISSSVSADQKILLTTGNVSAQSTFTSVAAVQSSEVQLSSAVQSCLPVQGMQSSTVQSYLPAQSLQSSPTVQPMQFDVMLSAAIVLPSSGAVAACQTKDDDDCTIVDMTLNTSQSSAVTSDEPMCVDPTGVVANIPLSQATDTLPPTADAILRTSGTVPQGARVLSPVSGTVPSGMVSHCIEEVSEVHGAVPVVCSALPSLVQMVPSVASSEGESGLRSAGEGTTGTTSAASFEFNVAGFDFAKYTSKMIESAQSTLVEFCADMLKSDIGSAVRRHLELELRRVEWKQQQQICEMKRNAALAQAELRMTLEHERELALAEMREQLDAERAREVEETKKKQWCANCGKEAIFYCCWNTSYCNYPCQQAHWPKHLDSCTQSADGGSSPPESSLSQDRVVVVSSNPQKTKSSTDVALSAAQQRQKQQQQKDLSDRDRQRAQSSYTGGSSVQYMSGHVPISQSQAFSMPTIQVMQQMQKQHQQQSPMLQIQYPGAQSYTPNINMAQYAVPPSTVMLTGGSRLRVSHPFVFPTQAIQLQRGGGAGGMVPIPGDPQLMFAGGRLLRQPSQHSMGPYQGNY